LPQPGPIRADTATDLVRRVSVQRYQQLAIDSPAFPVRPASRKYSARTPPFKIEYRDQSRRHNNRLAGRKGWFLYLAMDGDMPVATGALYLSDAAGERFAELNFGSTLPDHRGRGAQSALIARRVCFSWGVRVSAVRL